MCLGRSSVYNSIVDEAHCCDTSRSLRFLIGQRSKATSSEQGCKPTLVKGLLYRSDVWIQLPTELASFACTLQYWVLNTHIYTWPNGICVAELHTHKGETRHRFITVYTLRPDRCDPGPGRSHTDQAAIPGKSEMGGTVQNVNKIHEFSSCFRLLLNI